MRRGLIIMVISLLALWFGWYGSGILLLFIAEFVLNADAIGEQIEKERKEEEERFARLYPKEYEEEKRRRENMIIEWERKEREAESQAALEKIEHHRHVIGEFERLYFS